MNDDMANPLLDILPESAEIPSAGEVQEVSDGIFRWQPQHQSLSPSLWENREEPSFELKFVLHQDQAREVETWARQHLILDPHGDPHRDHAYRTHGLYFDTQEWDVFRRSPGYKRKKFRLRRYGAEPQVFLEQKRKQGARVAKRRTQVVEADLQRLHSVPAELGWPGDWFHQRISRRRLQPSCQISYDRKAFFGRGEERPLRLTLDRNLRCRPTQHWAIEEVADGPPLLEDKVLLELKYRNHLPALFKGLMQDLALTVQPLSKYRLAIQTALPEILAGGPAHA
jgi:hypothetical protein